MDTRDWLTIAAIVIGPIVGVLITRWLDQRRDRNTRRMDVFRILMRTRRNQISAEHVGALNVVEIEFSENKHVIEALRALMQHFGTQHVRAPEETTLPGDSKDIAAEKDRRFHVRLGQERQTLLAKLLHAMALALGFKIEQLEIFEGGYTPQGWFDVEQEQTLVRQFFASLAKGEKGFPIVLKDTSDSSDQG